MVLNIITILGSLVAIYFVIVWAVKCSEYDNKELPNNVEDSLLEIEDLSLDNVYYDRIYKLCENIMKLHSDELIMAKRNSEKRKLIVEDIIKIIDETPWRDTDMLIKNIRNFMESE